MEHSDNVVDSQELSHFDKAFDEALKLKVLESTKLINEVPINYHASCKIIMFNTQRNKQNAINRAMILTRQLFNTFEIKDFIKYGKGFRVEVVTSLEFTPNQLKSDLAKIHITEAQSTYDIFTKAFTKTLLAFVVKSPIGNTAFTYGKCIIIKKAPTYDLYIEIFAKPTIALKLAPIRYQRNELMDKMYSPAQLVTDYINTSNEDIIFPDKIELTV